MANPFISKYEITAYCSAKILLNHERPIYKVVQATLESDATKLTNYSFRVDFILSSANGESKRASAPITMNVKGSVVDLQKYFNQIGTFNIGNLDFLEIKASGGIENFKLSISLENYSVEFNSRLYFSAFEKHIALKNNSRIFFTAPFGKGKTTFLNLFFEEHQEEFEVFHLYPVNYSVSSNEDIFKFIKCELLIQLIGRNEHFDNTTYNITETLPIYLQSITLDDVLENIASFFSMLPNINEPIKKVGEKTFSLLSKILKQNKQINKEINDKNKATDFIKNIYNSGNNIYDDDLITQIIRQLIKRVSFETKKTTVFVVDDLDRLDPEHIFRVLNVLSAHFDNATYNIDGDNNKFGFDKIILSADIKNIYSIYAHKYGATTDFNGYINKYFSIQPYHFDNTKELKKQLRIYHEYLRETTPKSVFINMLELFLEDGLFNVRDFINLLRIDIFKEENIEQNVRYYRNSQFAYFELIYYLLQVYNSKAQLVAIIDKSSKTGTTAAKSRDRIFRKFASEYGLCFMFDLNKSKDEIYSYQLRGNVISFTKAETETVPNYFDVNLSDQEGSNSSFDFIPSDFFDFLLINIDEYFKRGKLVGDD